MKYGQHFPGDAIITAMRKWVISAGADFYKCSIIADKNAW
jgi:hypothetical protein